MGRLIDADALKQDLRKCQIESLIAHTEEKNVFDIINEQPTAYDVENVFCEWKKGKSSVFPIKTNCGNSIDVNYGYEFCPYCGKKIKVAPYTEGE